MGVASIRALFRIGGEGNRKGKYEGYKLVADRSVVCGGGKQQGE
jgi:hypothetical protein